MNIEKFNFNERLEFREVNLRDIEKKNSKKAVGSYNQNIPAKILRETSYICNHELQQMGNDKVLKNCQFPENLKLADITPVFKKDDKNLAKNYTLVRVAPKKLHTCSWIATHLLVYRLP